MHYHARTLEMIRQAAAQARSLGHSCVGSAHLLLAMAGQPGEAGQLLRCAGFGPELALTMTQLIYGRGTPGLPLPQGLTREAREVLRSAALEAREQSGREVLPIHVLLSLTRRDQCEGAKLLESSGVPARELFSRTVEYMRWEQLASARVKKEAVSLKLLGGKSRRSYDRRQ